ncbi:hypothetical protein [Streptomyces formicae]
MVDVLASQAAAHPARTAFRFLATGDVDDAGADVSYAALDRRSRAIGAALHERGLAGTRATLLHPPGPRAWCRASRALSRRACS